MVISTASILNKGNEYEIIETRSRCDSPQNAITRYWNQLFLIAKDLLYIFLSIWSQNYSKPGFKSLFLKMILIGKLFTHINTCSLDFLMV